MTPRESAIISAFTGVLCGPFTALHEYVELLMERPVFTSEMGNEEFAALIQEKSKDDFIELCESVES